MTDADAHSAARPLAAIILAAGKGTRMASDRPKTLHPVGGRAMLAHVIEAARRLGAARIAVVVGHGAEAVAAAARAAEPGCAVALQAEQNGTAHAVMQAREALEGFEGGAGSDVLVLYGDTPLISLETLERLRAARAEGAGVAVLGFETARPTGYGRLVTAADGSLLKIVEERDATAEERAITLCNSGVMCFDAARLFAWLDAVRPDNAKGELYLTDVAAIARAEGARVAVATAEEAETLGVNSKRDLAQAEAAFQERRRGEALAAGAILVAPETVFFSHDTRLGRDVLVEPNVVFGPGVAVEDGAQIRAFSHLEGAQVAAGAVVGPYARLRPGAEIGAEARVGNFVEVKNARLGAGAKANHLAYLGDAEIGARANVGAGTITCNYDGAAKHRTEIGADAFIGSNATLVAPLTLGAGVYVGAGSTVTQDAPDGALAIGRARQVVKAGYGARMREMLSAAGSEPAAADAKEPAETPG